MTRIVEEIRKWFSNGDIGGAYYLQTVGNEYPAYVLRRQNEFGVAIRYDGPLVNEEFANAYLYSSFHSINNVQADYLFLMSNANESRNEFASICENFVDPGKNGNLRNALVKDPVALWRKWKQVIGNRNAEKMPHAILGELLAYEKLCEGNKQIEWAGPEYKLHDIQAEACAFEVKSTTSHHGKKVSINGEMQLESADKPLYLWFFRFEEDIGGMSIDEVVERLVTKGIDRTELDSKLSMQGFAPGNHSRREKYQLMQDLIYPVNERFPKIVSKSFKGDVFPTGVSNLSYTVDLDTVKPLDIKRYKELLCSFSGPEKKETADNKENH